MEQKSTAGITTTPVVIGGINWSKPHRLPEHAAAKDRVSVARPATRDANPPLDRLPETAAEPASLDDFIVPGHVFRQELRREQRRADRSKSPLSIALFQFDRDQRDDVGLTSQLLALLRDNKRETDVLGDLDHDIAVLLPDTDSAGLQRFVTRLNGHALDLKWSIVTGTYPSDVFDYVLGQDSAAMRPQPLFVGTRDQPGSSGLFLKRCIDIVVAGVALLTLAPILLLVAAAIALTSPGPIIYKQARLGRGGRPFVFYKFRSMTANADDRIHREYVTGLITGGGDGKAQQGQVPVSWSKLKSDPRITPLGKLLRKTSIDELPQLFNVLKGDLSLIGPRPALPYEAAKYQAWHLRRILEVKPGISGLWQVAAGYDATFDDMVRLDLKYIRERSLLLDLEILAKTVLVVLRRHGSG